MAARKKSAPARKTARPKKAWPPPKARLDELIEEAIIDCYNDDEALSGFQAQLEGHLKLPFDLRCLGCAWWWRRPT